MKHKLTKKQEEKLKERVVGWRNKLLDVVDRARKGRNIPRKYEYHSLRDIQQYIIYCDFIIDGCYDKAVRIDFDTFAQEGIPTPIWDTIEYKLYQDV